MARPLRIHSPGSLSAVTSIALTVATLYFAQEVLIPLALSFLLSFLLAPLVKRVERYGLGRIASVLAVVVITFAVIFAIGSIVARQVYRLAEALPSYQEEIVRKARSVAGTGGTMGTNIEKLTDELSTVGSAPLTRPVVASTTQPAPGAIAPGDPVAADPLRAAAREVVGSPPMPAAPLGASPANPFYAVFLPAPISPIRTLGSYLGLALGPLGTAGLVIVFVVFMLLEREDLRDRLIRLISRGNTRSPPPPSTTPPRASAGTCSPRRSSTARTESSSASGFGRLGLPSATARVFQVSSCGRCCARCCGLCLTSALGWPRRFRS